MPNRMMQRADWQKGLQEGFSNWVDNASITPHRQHSLRRGYLRDGE